ncbi:MFS transporter [Pigmentiphaga sp.]|uniref:HdeD family acid-resistance protein n=1 Tax=Pigmentiphaga sp. TaxID=1977564 RepID=UPI0025E35B67|nr:MFS transporter [Pigmentiphaga sp.]
MIQLALLLFGAGFARRNVHLLILIGFAWAALGAIIALDGMDGVRYFPLTLFGALLLVESLVTLTVAGSGMGAQKAVLAFKGGIFLLIALLILTGGSVSNLLLAIILGLTYFVLGVFQIASAWVLRYDRWRLSVLGGCAQVLFGLFLFQPYPSHYAGTVSYFIGITMLAAGINTMRVAARARKLSEQSSMFDLLAPLDLRAADADANPPPSPQPPAPDGPLTVHVWTPVGSAKDKTVSRPVFNRYIAAVDVQGVISTGHAAMEAPPSTYISLYPAVDIDRSPSEFFNLLKAVKENDVPGKFQPDYPTESKAWCPSNWQVRFDRYDHQKLQAFWQRYRGQEIYNLTRRNCSSSVSYALESALDGVLDDRSRSVRQVLRTLLMPELWIAAQVRQRAQVMAWTPGLTLDYSRALRAVIHPVQKSWFSRFLAAATRMTSRSRA